MNKKEGMTLDHFFRHDFNKVTRLFTLGLGMPEERHNTSTQEERDSKSEGITLEKCLEKVYSRHLN